MSRKKRIPGKKGNGGKMCPILRQFNGVGCILYWHGYLGSHLGLAAILDYRSKFGGHLGLATILAAT